MHKSISNVIPIIHAKPALPRKSDSCRDVTVILSPSTIQTSEDKLIVTSLIVYNVRPSPV